VGEGAWAVARLRLWRKNQSSRLPSEGEDSGKINLKRKKTGQKLFHLGPSTHRVCKASLRLGRGEEKGSTILG